MMKLRFAAAVFAAVAFAGVAMAQVAAPERIASAGKVMFCTELAYPPWEYINPETLAPEGYDIDLAAAITKAMGVANEHVNIAFDGLIPALQAGQCDAIISGLYDKPERREVVDFVNYAFSGSSLIVKGDSDLYFDDISKLSGHKVSVASGSTLEEDLVKASAELTAAGSPGIDIVTLQSGTDAFQQLIAGLVEVYYGSTDQAGYFNTQQPGMLKIASPQIGARPNGVATLHKDRDLHEAIAAAFAAIQANGEYQAINEKWNFTEMDIKYAPAE